MISFIFLFRCRDFLGGGTFAVDMIWIIWMSHEFNLFFSRVTHDEIDLLRKVWHFITCRDTMRAIQWIYPTLVMIWFLIFVQLLTFLSYQITIIFKPWSLLYFIFTLLGIVSKGYVACFVLFIDMYISSDCGLRSKLVWSWIHRRFTCNYAPPNVKIICRRMAESYFRDCCI